MGNTVNTFLEYFNIDELLNVTSSTAVSELLVMMFIGFISMIFCIVGIRVILEIVKILIDYKRWI